MTDEEITAAADVVSSAVWAVANRGGFSLDQAITLSPLVIETAIQTAARAFVENLDVEELL